MPFTERAESSRIYAMRSRALGSPVPAQPRHAGYRVESDANGPSRSFCHGIDVHNRSLLPRRFVLMTLSLRTRLQCVVDRLWYSVYPDISGWASTTLPHRVIYRNI